MWELRHDLLLFIERVRLDGGVRLPPERDLARKFGVARGTLRKELTELVRSGCLERRTGRGGGSFIRSVDRPRYVEPLPEPPMLITRDLDRAAGVPTWLAEQGHAPGTRVLRATERRANPVEQETLDPEDGKVFAIQRVRSADGIPVSLEEMTLPAQRFPGLLEDSLASVYELMDREYGVRVARCEETILSAVASPASAVLLCVEPGSALHDIRRRAYDSRGACFEISRDLFRADLTSLTTTSR
ncbi:GntR family transcriptional regulator [Rothia koreensis]|jgi:GntR family transcriptional regulator|uniref:GntR family transcriptional regulator n=1 Tax=Rothia koreensis TaxID=592378 RepID=UPI0037CB1788